MKKAFALLVLIILAFSHAQTCADGFRLFEHAAGTDCIPENPQRIVSLHDLTVTLALAELGAIDKVVGSHGRLTDDGTATLRPALRTFFDVDFTTTDMTFIGVFDQIDIEIVAALEPDLIIGRSSDDVLYDQMSLIAPTVLVDRDTGTLLEKLATIADAAGEMESYQRLLRMYQERIAFALESISDPEAVSVTIMSARSEDNIIVLYENFYALSQVLKDMGFGRTEVVDELLAELEGSGRLSASVKVSPEVLPTLDADFILMPYFQEWAPMRNLPSVEAELNDMLGGDFCTFLEACKANQLYFFNGSRVYSASFRSLDAAIDMIQAAIIGRDYVDIDAP